MTSEKYYAHTTPDGRLQTIEEHAKGTAERAKEYASAFGFGDAAYAEGLFHDVGKYAPAFQARLRGAGEKYEHSSAGMRLFAERAAQRRSNASGAFSVLPGADVSGKTLLLIDDIVTTGATLSECCRVLKGAGAARVDCAAFASPRNDNER